MRTRCLHINTVLSYLGSTVSAECRAHNSPFYLSVMEVLIISHCLLVQIVKGWYHYRQKDIHKSALTGAWTAFQKGCCMFPSPRAQASFHLGALSMFSFVVIKTLTFPSCWHVARFKNNDFNYDALEFRMLSTEAAANTLDFVKLLEITGSVALPCNSSCSPSRTYFQETRTAEKYEWDYHCVSVP